MSILWDKIIIFYKLSTTNILSFIQKILTILTFEAIQILLNPDQSKLLERSLPQLM